MSEQEAPDTRPVVKLRPGKGRRLAGGGPWAYADEIAMDRRTRRLVPGTLVRLMDGGTDLGTAAFNSESRIAARLIDPAGEAAIDEGWFAAHIARALAIRERLFEAPFYRLVHAEGDGLPGVVVDRYGDALVLQPNAAWAERLLGPLSAALMAATGGRSLVVNATSRVRRLEGLECYLEVTHGRVEAPVEVPMNGATYLADLLAGQKTGLYYDQRPNHAFVAPLARGGRVLDLFAHIGGFSLAAGAAEALAVDSSEPALQLAERGAEASGVAARFRTRRADVFDLLAALAEEEAVFEVVASDPPAFAPSKQALNQGLRAYRKLATLAAPRVAPGGWLVLCSCSHAVDVEAFHRANAAGIAAAGRSGALVYSGRAGPDHPVHTALPETSYLKALIYRLDG